MKKSIAIAISLSMPNQGQRRYLRSHLGLSDMAIFVGEANG